MLTINCQICGVEVIAMRSSRRYCDECADKVRRANNAARLVIWQKANPEKCSAYSRKWHQAHPEVLAEENKRWKAANPEKVAAKQHRNYERYKAKRLAQGKQWVKDHPEETNASRRVRNHNRRARVAQAEGKWTFKEFQELCEASDNHCYYCHKKSDKLTADHMTPLARGGSNGIENIVPVCGSCNSAKGTSTLLEYFYPKARNLQVAS